MKNTLAIPTIVGGLSSGTSGTTAAGVSSVNGRSGSVVLSSSDIPNLDNTLAVLEGQVASNVANIEQLQLDIVEKQNRGDYVLREEVLTKTNEQEYNPTLQYHPVTKKYVDEITAKKFDNDNLVGGNFIEIVPLNAQGGIDQYTTFLLDCNYRTLDLSQNNIQISEQTGTISYRDSKPGFGEALYLTGGTVAWKHDEAFNFGTEDFTFDFICGITNREDSNGSLYFSDENKNTYGIQISGGQLNFNLTSDFDKNFNHTFENTGHLYHIVAQRNGDKLYYYVDGELKKEVDFSGSAIPFNQINIYSGASSLNDAVLFDEIRVYKGKTAFTPVEGPINVPLYPYTKLEGETGLHVINYTGAEIGQATSTNPGIVTIATPTQVSEGTSEEAVVNCKELKDRLDKINGSNINLTYDRQGVETTILLNEFANSTQHDVENLTELFEEKAQPKILSYATKLELPDALSNPMLIAYCVELNCLVFSDGSSWKKIALTNLDS